MGPILEISEEPAFLTIEQVEDIHREMIAFYGGISGIRDRALLESAVMAPRQTFGGDFLHRTLEEMAAAYWAGLAGNHPLIDRNKR